MLNLSYTDQVRAARELGRSPRERLTAAVLVRVGEMLDSPDHQDRIDSTEALELVSAAAHRWQMENLGENVSMGAERLLAPYNRTPSLIQS